MRLDFDRAATAFETLVLGLWAGAMVGFAFIFAPIAFATIRNLDAFGAMVAKILAALGVFGYGCAALAAAAALARSTSVRRKIGRIALLVVAVAATAYELGGIVPQMTAVAARVPGPLDSVAKSDPRRAAYDALHRESTQVYGVAFLCVAAALATAPFGRRPSGR